MIASENGYIPNNDLFIKNLRAMSELEAPECPAWDIICFGPLLDSCDIAVNEWNKIAEAIAQRYEKYDGFVVLHGTDTMAYSASALSFMLENLDKPVVFTGSQIPLCELRSDGRNNIVTAMVIAASDVIKEVCLYFNGKLLRGNRSTKQSSDRLSAFASPNFPPLAEVGIEIRYQESAMNSLPPGEGKALGVQLFQNLPIGVIKVFPGIQFEIFESIMTEALKGVVLETFGTGNIPSSQGSLLKIIEKAHKNGTVIIVCSQCMQGTVSLGTYATSKALHDIGAVNGKNMTTECALTKLYYLFSKGYPADEIKKMMVRNLRGELSE